MVSANQLGRMALSGYGGGDTVHPSKTVNEIKQNKILKENSFASQKDFQFSKFSLTRLVS